MTTTATVEHGEGQRSPFANIDVCGEAGLVLPDDTARPLFDDDRWDFTAVVGLPVQMRLVDRRFDFTAITDPAWRSVAKELILALLAPRHPAVAHLPRAYRTPLHLRSCQLRLQELTRFFDWLTRRGIATLADVDTHVCEAYFQFRRYIITGEDGSVVGEQGYATRRGAA